MPSCRSTNQQAPCWPLAAPGPLPLPPASASQNPRWRDPDKGVPRPECGLFSAPCCCRSADSSGAMAWGVTPQLPAPRPPWPFSLIAGSSTNTASRDRTWCRATGPYPSGPTRGVSRGTGRGSGGSGSLPTWVRFCSAPLLCTPYARCRGPFSAAPPAGQCGPPGSLRLTPSPPVFPLPPGLLPSLIRPAVFRLIWKGLVTSHHFA